jgi:TRAP-type C4-dicarboxylate transport system permease small subunit
MDKIILKIYNLLAKIASAAGGVACVGYILVIVVSLVDVVSALAFNKPLQGQIEMVEALMLISVFGSLTYAQTKRAHINMSVVIDLFPKWPKLLCLGITSLISTIGAAVLGYAAWLRFDTAYTMNEIMGILRWPKFPLYIVESVCMYFFAIVLLIDTIIIFAALRYKGIYKYVQDEYGLKGAETTEIKATI